MALGFIPCPEGYPSPPRGHVNYRGPMDNVSDPVDVRFVYYESIKRNLNKRLIL